MSDSDDGFDEEAVREELREKYEDEREDREATARMSELLLQGATMTNDHCDRCGSPMFRQDGQMFCPNCQHAAQQAKADQATQGQSQGQAQGQEQAQGQGQVQGQGQQAASGRRADPGDARARPPTGQDEDHRPQGEPARGDGRQRQPDGERTDDQPNADAASRVSARDDPSRRDLPEHAPTADATGPAGDALESTIAALARRAASADDPRTAREYLEAAREAAEALAALR